MKKSEKKLFEKKIREYRKFLKDDFDWDWIFVLKLLQYKLKRTRECIVSNDIIKGSKRVGREIRAVENLLERVITEPYYKEISKDFRKKYGSLKMKSEKNQFKKGYSSVSFVFTKETQKNGKSAHKEFARLQRKADQMQRTDLKKAFELMNKNLWNWWD